MAVLCANAVLDAIEGSYEALLNRGPSLQDSALFPGHLAVQSRFIAQRISAAYQNVLSRNAGSDDVAELLASSDELWGDLEAICAQSTGEPRLGQHA